MVSKEELIIEMVAVLIMTIFVVGIASIFLIHWREDRHSNGMKIFLRAVVLFQLGMAILFECLWAVMLAGGNV